jgi:hypothetical protein
VRPDPAGAGRPGPHPDPPPDLATRALPLCRVAPPWFRCHRRDRAPLFFGRSGDNRFDDPAGEFGVLYLAADPPGAFIETFGQATGEVIVTRAAIARRCVSVVTAPRPLTLVDLTGPGLVQIGADARLWAGDDGPAQRFSRALWAHPARPDGLYYPARHDPSRCAIALYDRGDLPLWTAALGSFDLLGDILSLYKLTLLDL